MKSILVAAAVGLAVTLLGTPIAIRAFRVWGWGQRIREDGPHTHMEKMGTPTMGGIVIVDRLVRRRTSRHRFTFRHLTPRGSRLLFAAVGFGIVGFLDDFMKVRRRPLARSVEVAEVLRDGGGVGRCSRPSSCTTRRHDGHIRRAVVHPRHGHQARASCSTCGRSSILTASSHVGEPHRRPRRSRVGLVDPGAVGVTCSSRSGSSATRAGSGRAGRRATRSNADAMLDTAIVAAAMMGAVTGFLWWNAAPARIFMGDTGSLALGGLFGGAGDHARTRNCC